MKSVFSRLPARRKIGLLAVGFAGAVALGFAVVLLDPQLRPHAIAQAENAVAQAENILGLLEGRSPGERTFALLTKKSPGTPGNRGESPPADVERGLGKVFPPQPESPELAFLIPPELLLPGPMSEPEFSGPIEPLDEITVPAGAGSFAPPGGIFLPPGGGFVSAPPEEGGNPPPQSTAPAVPEPSTWAMMLIGFGLCAAAMRSKRNFRGLRARVRCRPIS